MTEPDGTGLERRRLGSTPFTVTAMGYGSGGFSRAGIGRGPDHAAAVITAVVESGIDFVDTAEAYGTEAAVAAGIARATVDPATVTVATKYLGDRGGQVLDPDAVRARVLARLGVLGRDRLDLIQIHSVLPDRYEQIRDTHLPVLEQMRAEGLVTAIGITEQFQVDTGHEMLGRAVADRCWDTVMVGYNLLNPSAFERVIRPAADAGIGVIVMFAVRDALVDLDRLRRYVTTVEAAPADAVDRVDRVARIAAEEGGSLTDLAYRFAVSTPGTSTVLVGTGNPEHLAHNRRAFERERLGAGRVAELAAVFGDLDVFSGQGSRPR